MMVYQQVEVSECGLVCVAYASEKLGARLDLTALRRQHGISNQGLNFRQLADIAGSLHMLARGVQCELADLKRLSAPAILHWGFNHFVVLNKCSKRYLHIFDPSKGHRRIAIADASQSFTGVALEMSRAPGFQRRRERSPLALASWFRLTPALYGGLFQILLMSLLLQVYVLASPFYVQLAIDQAALKGDMDFLAILAIGFGAFGVFNAVAGLIRGYAVQQLTARLSWDMSLRLFRHLIRLPLPWHQRRRLADTVSRFDGINPIRDLISGSLITGVVDGLLGLSTLVMLILFSWELAGVVVAGVVINMAVSILSLPAGIRLGGEALTARIAETGSRIDALRAIQTVKIMSAELMQEMQWSNKYSDVLRANLANARFTMWITTVQQLLDSLFAVVVIYMAASKVANTTMSVGIMFAFLSYQTQFKTALNNLLAQVIQWKLTDVYSHRLADVVLHPIETGLDSAQLEAFPHGAIELSNVAFRYGALDAFVLKNISMKIAAGESVAVIGPSGIGKSTLLKVMAGLFAASGGEISIDGRSIASWGPKTVRGNVGIVLQDDELLSGSVFDNVAFFAEHIDRERVWQVLDAVALKDEVLAMSMGGDTFIGEMGSALSGGQKQRLRLARSLYKQPKILFHDEATSHLDIASEARVNSYLRSMDITRVIIAHRLETIRSADRIFDLRSGRFILHQQLGKH